MAACGSLQHIFINSLTEKPTLLESLSPWNQIKPVDQSTFIEMFGELQLDANSQSSSSTPFPMSPLSLSSSSTPTLDLNLQNNDGLEVINKESLSSESFASIPKISCPSSQAKSDSLFSNSETSARGFKYTGCHKKTDSFSSMNSESLQLCTEGLGFESFDDVEDLKNEINEDWQNQQEKVSVRRHSQTVNLCGEFRRSRTSGGEFPPPISCIGQSGKPWVIFKSYRHDGRFVLKEIRMPSQEFLHACREDGRLKLQFVQPNDDFQDLEEQEEEKEYKKDKDQELEDREIEGVEVDEEEENGSICNVREKERQADARCETGNDLQ